MNRNHCICASKGRHVARGSVRSARRGGACTHGVREMAKCTEGRHTLMSHGEPVKSELFCVKKRWPKKEASRPEVLLSVNAILVSLLSGAVSVRGPNRAKIEGWT